ncbi:MAG: exodeoxyribonuclease VII large subunit [Candidatus Amulumruptor caecigallinarius]|nr:exodeoxyribonuclease VII large subunit [Candidatus Amulumruptor caecigallinarius]
MNTASGNSIKLSELMQMLGNAIRTTPAIQGVWVMAELSDVRVSGGHCYMELVEKDSAGTTRAKVRAMIWSSTFVALRNMFRNITGRDIASGIKVLVYGSVTHHNVYGLSFNITGIDPSYTLGDMERVRREILEKLTKAGVVNQNKTLPPPAFPQRIAVISAPGAAGYGDFVNQTVNNPDGFKIYMNLFPAVLQGDRTAESVINALNMVESTIDIWDCVVIIRGGGSTTDLAGFDDYNLALRVATFPLPVIVGIGHERDRTVLDEIACVRCKTPTAVSAYITDTLRERYGHVCEIIQRIARYCSDASKGEHLRLSTITQSIPSLARNAIYREKMRLPGFVAGITALVRERVSAENATLTSTSVKIESAAKGAINNAATKIRHYEDILRLLDPANTLKRGYSVTRINGKAVTDPATLRPGDEIETTLLEGKIISNVRL